MLKNLKNKGITLIALVITIIVLLILAGISISMLSGDNSILKRAGASKDSTEIAQEKENITLAYNSLIIDKKVENSGTISGSDFDKVIKSYDSRASATSERDKYIVTFSNGHKYSLYNSGKITEYTTTPYAVDELTVKVSGDTVESPYYVNYPSAKGTIKCRVLYNDSTYGLQIISTKSVTKVLIGKDDPNENVTGDPGSIERCINSYNRAITTLNEKAEEYIATNDGSVLATDARCVGSNPDSKNKNYPENLTGNERKAQMYVLENDYNEKIFKSNNFWQTDNTRLSKLGLLKITDAKNDWYYLVRRVCFEYSGLNFCISLVSGNSGTLNNWGLFRMNTSGVIDEHDNYDTGGLRPIFLLSPNVKIIGGEGTEEVPFEIGL